MWLLDYLFDRFRWYRRWCGGHWELWWVDFPVCSEQWHQVRWCSLELGRRPALCRGTPRCEDWGEAGIT